MDVYDTHAKETYGSDAEKLYIQYWLDQIYEDALNHGISQMTEVNWNRIISANLGNLKDIVQKQYNQNKGVTVMDGRIEIHDDVLM